MRRRGYPYRAFISACGVVLVSLSAHAAIALAGHGGVADQLIAGQGSLLPASTSSASTAGLPVVPLSAIGYVKDIGLVPGSTMVYATTDKGIYRSTQPPYNQWTQQSSTPPAGQGLISVNPAHPNDVLIDGCRSQDGAQTLDCSGWNGGDIVALARSPHDPSLIVAGTIGADLFHSANDGATWTQVYTPTNAEDTNSGISAVVVAPRDPTHMVAGEVLSHDNNGDLLLSTDAGRHWSVVERIPSDYNYPSSLATDANTGVIWVTWGQFLRRSSDGEQPWTMPYSAQLPTVSDPFGPGSGLALANHDFITLATDPLTGRLYTIDLNTSAAVPGTTLSQTHIMALDRNGHVDAFLPADVNAGDRLTITADGYLFSWWFGSIYPWVPGSPGTDSPHYPLTLRPLIGSGNWQLSASLSAPARHTARALLGQPLSPTVMCDGDPCQFFDKGAVSQPSHGAYAFVALVPRLLASRAAQPVGIGTSALTYRNLAAHGQRVAPPPGFHGGTQTVRGGVFVPYSAALTPAPGFVVPPSFWSYITQPAQAPHGWQADFGLPLTNALTVRVHKGAEGWREIVVQAFAKAILTDDPRNPPGWRVERANIGLDYAAQFPQAVR